MPKARILSHQIDKDSIETLDQKEGLFNPVKVEDVRNFDSVSQDAMEERAKTVFWIKHLKMQKISLEKSLTMIW